MVPRVPAVQGAFVVPDLEAVRQEGVSNGLRRLAIPRGITQEDRQFRAIWIGRRGHDGANDPRSCPESQQPLVSLT